MSNDPRRVVVTGMGIVSPLGCDIDRFWSRLIAGQSGVGLIHNFDASSLPVRIAAEVRDFDPLEYMDRRTQRRMDPFAQYALAAAILAQRRLPARREQGARAHGRRGGHRGRRPGHLRRSAPHPVDQGQRPHEPAVHPHDDPQHGGRPDLARPGHQGAAVDRLYGLRGEHQRHRRRLRDHSPRRGRRHVRRRRRGAGLQRRASPPSPPCAPCRRATTSPTRRAARSTATATASSWARAPASWCSRSSRHAEARGATIYAEVVGYGMSSDAFHLTLPDETGQTQARAMRMAIDEAGIDPVRDRLHQRPRHLHAARRRRRDARHQARPGRRERPQGGDLLDQVDDRPLPGRLGRPRGDHLGADHRARRHPADHQPVHARSGVRPRLRAATRRARRRSTWPPPTRSASAATTRRSSFGATADDRHGRDRPARERAAGAALGLSASARRRPRPGGGQSEPLGVPRLRLSPAHRRP